MCFLCRVSPEALKQRDSSQEKVLPKEKEKEKDVPKEAAPREKEASKEKGDIPITKEEEEVKPLQVLKQPVSVPYVDTKTATNSPIPTSASTLVIKVGQDTKPASSPKAAPPRPLPSSSISAPAVRPPTPKQNGSTQASQAKESSTPLVSRSMSRLKGKRCPTQFFFQ